MAGEASKWRDVEPILKWGAVSYACGFLIVMIHTARLGIPALQLIEPINIWIGLPIAAVLFFFDKLLGLWKQAQDKFEIELAKAQAFGNEIADAQNLEKVYDQILQLVIQAFNVFSPLAYPGLGGILAKLLFGWYRNRLVRASTRLRAGPDKEPDPEKKRDALRKAIGQFVSLVGKLEALRNFSRVIAGLALIFVACALYVGVLYSKIPQAWGGGRPIEVQLIVSEEALPKEAPEFRDVVHPGDNRKGEKSKTSLTIQAVLYYRTDDAYYVRIEKEHSAVGPMISLSHHATEGIIFGK